MRKLHRVLYIKCTLWPLNPIILQMRALAFKIRQGHFKTGCCILKAHELFIQKIHKFVITPMMMILKLHLMTFDPHNDLLWGHKNWNNVIPIKIKSLISIRQVTTNSTNVNPNHYFICIKPWILNTLCDLLTPFVTLHRVNKLCKLATFIAGILAEFDKPICLLFLEMNINTKNANKTHHNIMHLMTFDPFLWPYLGFSIWATGQNQFRSVC